MSKIAVSTKAAPAAIGPYNQAIRAGNLLFCSGQVALPPEGGELVAGGIEAQTRQVLNNLTAVLNAGGTTWEHVVRTTIYLSDLAHFATVNAIYAEFVGEVAPARATVEVSRLPKEALVEIDAIALVES